VKRWNAWLLEVRIWFARVCFSVYDVFVVIGGLLKTLFGPILSLANRLMEPLFRPLESLFQKLVDAILSPLNPILNFSFPSFNLRFSLPSWSVHSICR
jgi:hypothetical protein